VIIVFVTSFVKKDLICNRKWCFICVFCD